MNCTCTTASRIGSNTTHPWAPRKTTSSWLFFLGYCTRYTSILQLYQSVLDNDLNMFTFVSKYCTGRYSARRTLVRLIATVQLYSTEVPESNTTSRRLSKCTVLVYYKYSSILQVSVCILHWQFAIRSVCHTSSSIRRNSKARLKE